MIHEMSVVSLLGQVLRVGVPMRRSAVTVKRDGVEWTGTGLRRGEHEGKERVDQDSEVWVVPIIPTPTHFDKPRF